MKSKKKYVIIGTLAAISCSAIIGVGINIYKNHNIDVASIDNDVQKYNIITEEKYDSIDEDKKIYIDSHYMFAFKPTIENLYKNSDVVVVGKYSSDEKTYAKGINVYTQTKFNVTQVIKNTTELDVSKNVTFNRVGGTMALDKYIANNPTIKEGEFEDINVNARSSYYIVQEYGPEDKLNFNKTQDNVGEYMLFLNYKDNELSTCSAYNGIIQIKNQKVYDYDTDKFVEIDSEEVSKVLVKSK